MFQPAFSIMLTVTTSAEAPIRVAAPSTLEANTSGIRKVMGFTLFREVFLKHDMRSTPAPHPAAAGLSGPSTWTLKV